MIKALQSMSLGDLYSNFFAYESCLDGLNPSGGNSGESSINAASHYQFGNRHKCGRGGERGNFGGDCHDKYNG
jgi:hypothetical protein